MAAKEEKEAEAPVAPPKKSKKKLIIIAVVALLVLGGGGFFMFGRSKPVEEKVEETDKPKVFKTIKLDPIIVNLTEAKSFLKVSMMLEYDEELLNKLTATVAGGKGKGGGGAAEGGEAAGGFPPAMMDKEPKIKDKIIAIMSIKTPADVLSGTGKQALKDEIIEGVNEVLEFPEPVVVGVFFTEFIVQ